MYSREERMKAVELYMKYEKSAAAVLREVRLSRSENARDMVQDFS